MRRFAVALLLALPLAAQRPLRVEPPAPLSTDRVKLFFVGAPCGYPHAEVTVTPGHVDVHLFTTGGCITVRESAYLSIDAGMLAPGSYTAHIDDNRPESWDTAFVVREAGPLTFAPFAVPLAGGTAVRISRDALKPWDDDYALVSVGAKMFEAPIPGDATEGPLAITTPASSSPGPVDVAVRVGAESWKQRSALIYYDPAQPPDRTFAEPVLFPIAYDGPGALGTQWHTENMLYTSFVYEPQVALPRFFEVPCDGCGDALAKGGLFPPMARADGLTVWLMRGTGERLRGSSFVYETSRLVPPSCHVSSIPSSW